MSLSRNSRAHATRRTNPFLRAVESNAAVASTRRVPAHSPPLVFSKSFLRLRPREQVGACATGSHALGEALKSLQLGEADVMLAGGTEAAVTALGFAGFSSIGRCSGCLSVCSGKIRR